MGRKYAFFDEIVTVIYADIPRCIKRLYIIINQAVHQLIPIELKSSTKMISWSSDFGDLFITLWIVRKRVDQPSLWNGMMTEVFGKRDR